MSDQMASGVDRLISNENSEPPRGSKPVLSSEEGSCSVITSVVDVDEAGEHGVPGEDEALIQMVECRICQEEDSVNNLEVPCACNGSLKFAHRKCVQHWCNEKGDITCEICHQPYQPGYTAPPPRPQSDETIIDISEDWASSGVPLDLNGAPLLAAAAAERHFLDADYDDYADTGSSGAAFCRAAALILMALLLLRHALNLTNPDDDDDDASTFFSLFVLRAAGFLLPCYIMAWAISILQRRRQRQEAAALAAAEVAFMIHAGQRRGLHFAISPAPAATHHHEIPQ